MGRMATRRNTTRRICLELRLTGHAVIDPEFGQAKADYLRLSQATAQRTLRFWKVRVGTKDSAGSPAKHATA